MTPSQESSNSELIKTPPNKEGGSSVTAKPLGHKHTQGRTHILSKLVNTEGMVRATSARRHILENAYT